MFSKWVIGEALALVGGATEQLHADVLKHGIVAGSTREDALENLLSSDSSVQSRSGVVRMVKVELLTGIEDCIQLGKGFLVCRGQSSPLSRRGCRPALR